MRAGLGLWGSMGAENGCGSTRGRCLELAPAAPGHSRAARANGPGAAGHRVRSGLRPPSRRCRSAARHPAALYGRGAWRRRDGGAGTGGAAGTRSGMSFYDVFRGFFGFPGPCR